MNEPIRFPAITPPDMTPALHVIGDRIRASIPTLHITIPDPGELDEIIAAAHEAHDRAAAAYDELMAYAAPVFAFRMHMAADRRPWWRRRKLRRYADSWAEMGYQARERIAAREQHTTGDTES